MWINLRKLITGMTVGTFYLPRDKTSFIYQLFSCSRNREY